MGPGRGSAAGSMVSYCLHITDIDPMQYSLYFERFLNPERVSMPDIDMDFGDTRRGEVVDYVRRKYGDDHVAQIVTFGTMAARAAIRDVGRVLNMTYAEMDTVAKLVPTGPLHITLEDALKLSKQLPDLYEQDQRVKKLIDTARALEGMPRHASTHAAGVVITKRPVYDYVPLATERRIRGLPVHHDHPGGAGPAENGLSGPAEPDGAGRRGENGAEGPARISAWRTSRRTTRRPSTCSPRARPPACSRWSPPA